MKKLLICSVFATGMLGAVLAPQVCVAQVMPTLPVDTAVVIGTLPNGLTYYIRHNEYPKGQADFYIAQKVGSVQEEDNQRGLAHFLEHMCFNGTKNFPGNSIVTWLETKGVKFGYQLNAYTSTDETVYNICSVPTANVAVTDSVLLILHDWSHDLLLDGDEIDAERGVIHEEWRSRNVGQNRIMQDALPTIYPDSKYGQRYPIGTMEVVDNFAYQELRDYYKKWYRPDLQGIIVCGDIDVARTEQQIKQIFADIEMPENPAVRESYPVPDTPGTIYYIGKDKEMPNTVAYLMFKHEPMSDELKGTVGELVYNYITDMVASMLNSRFNDMMSNPDAPFAVAQADMGQYLLSSTEDMFAVIGVAKEGDIRPTLQSIYREVLRAKRGGFTQSEYDRARSSYLTQLEQQYNNRNHQETSALVTPMVRNFIENTALCSIDTRYETIQLMSQAIDLATINQLLESMVTDDNRVVLCFLPDAENSYIPTKMELSDLMRDVDDEQIDAFVDNVREDPLIPSLPKPGTITATTTDEKYGFTEWTLSNGAKVIIKPTEFKNDEIVFQAFAHGGIAALIPNVSVSDYKAFDIFDAGIGEYSNADLTKYLSGKNVDFTQRYGNNARKFDGSTTPKDLPTLMELIYGYFTAPNYTEDEFAAGQNLYYGLLHNQELNPQFAFQRALIGTMFTSPYRQVLTADDVKNATREGVTAIAKNMVANAADYTFTFVGNVDAETLRPLVEQYIATLPANAKKASKRVTKPLEGFTIQAGSDVSTSTIKMETPQTYASVFVSGSEEFNAHNSTLVSVAGQILTARLLKTIREEMGAVYSISAQGSMGPLQPGNTSLMTTFPMNPEQKDAVLVAIKQEFDNMASQVTDEELNKVKEFMVKSYTEDRERNSAWADDISTYKLYGVDKMFDALNEVSALTPADVQNFVKELLSQGNYRVVILDPEQ